MTGKNYALHLRTSPKGKRIYYVQFRLPSGKWSNAKSTGESARSRAETWAEDELLKNGVPIPGKDITFGEYAKDFFSWNGRWVTNKKVEGRRIGEHYCLDCTTILESHVIPAIGEYKLKEIDKNIIRTFRNDLYQKGYSGSTINKYLVVISIILTDAEDRGYIRAIPKIEKAIARNKQKGILTIEEVKRLFSFKWESISSYGRPSKERFIGYIGNLLACVTGIRLGELQGLLLCDLHLKDGFIIVRRSWDNRTKQLLNTTKSGRDRNILIPSYVINGLHRLIVKNPYNKTDSFLFYSSIETQPIDTKVFIKAFFEALKKIGIDEAERKRRNISFHSHRHWFNSLLLNAKVPLHKVQSLTGHLSLEMAGHYYHLDDMNDVKQIQEGLFTDIQIN